MYLTFAYIFTWKSLGEIHNETGRNHNSIKNWIYSNSNIANVYKNSETRACKSVIKL